MKTAHRAVSSMGCWIAVADLKQTRNVCLRHAVGYLRDMVFDLVEDLATGLTSFVTLAFGASAG
jgi:hypothetical protein